MFDPELVERGRHLVLAAPQLYIDIDLEADGIAGHGSMLAIGAQSATGESFYSEIRPTSSKFFPSNRKFCEEHGLERERLEREAPEVVTVMRELNTWITGLATSVGKTPVFAGFNAAYDWPFVDLYFAEAGIDNPLGHAAFDLKSLAMALDPGWDWERTGKSSLPSLIQPDRVFTHNALEDAQYQQQIHFGMAALLAEHHRYA